MSRFEGSGCYIIFVFMVAVVGIVAWGGQLSHVLDKIPEKFAPWILGGIVIIIIIIREWLKSPSKNK